jgi:hypothetical protein
MKIICGHTLTRTETLLINAIQDYMRQHSGDSFWTANTSPKGDGRLVPVTEIFGERNNADNARRRRVARLAELGILGACEIEYFDGQLRGKPLMMRNQTIAELREENATLRARIEALANATITEVGEDTAGDKALRHIAELEAQLKASEQEKALLEAELARLKGRWSSIGTNSATKNKPF